MGHVGDGDDQAEPFAVRLGEHRIVEVARILAVDGDQRHVAQILPRAQAHQPGALGLGDALRRGSFRECPWVCDSRSG